MKFKFAYENVLKNKKIQKDVAQRDLVLAQNKAETEDDHLQNMYQLVKDSRKANDKNLKNIEMLKWTQLFIEGQAIKIERQKKSLRELNQIVEEKRDGLAQLAKDFKVFEKLREKMKERHRKSERKSEMKRNDELVVMYTKRGR